VLYCMKHYHYEHRYAGIFAIDAKYSTLA